MNRRGDCGAATLAAVGLVAVLLIGAAVAGQLSRAVAAAHRADAAADLTALSAATAIAELAASPCAAAAQTARRNGAALLSCQVSYPQSGVQVDVKLRNVASIWPVAAATADARAGLREVPLTGSARPPAWPP